MKRLPLSVLLLALTVACAGGEAEPEVDMALACQLTACVCAGEDKLFFERVEPEPVLWRDNGDAYCPEGLELRLAED